MEGGQYFSYQPGRRFPRDDAAQVEDIARWLRRLPRPIGIMACYDLRGQQLLDACRRCAIAVPDQIAVIGVDNDELLCELSDPPLTSVIPNTHRTGYDAAALLDDLMSGKRARAQTHLVPPVGVATDLPLSEIAERAGFAHVEYLSVVFKKQFGVPPSRYRARHRPGRPGKG